jgi:integrase
MARGSILRRRNKDGTTTFSIKFRDAEGRQVKLAAGRTRGEAEKALNAALVAVDQGRVHKPDNERFSVAADRWLQRKRPRLEASTFADYERHLRLRLVPVFGSMQVSRITRRHVHDYVHRLDVTGELSRKTINDSLIPLRQVLAVAVREGVIATNPAVSVDRDEPIELPYEQPEMHPLTRTQAHAYLDSAPADYRLLAEVLIGAGLRIGEALALTWRDIDRDGGAISVTKSFKMDGVGTPKGDRGRDVMVANYLMDMLVGARPSAAAEDDLIFHRDGQPIRRQRVHRFWHRPTLIDAGLPLKVRVHDLRHTAATIWLASRQSIYFVQQQLGHKDIQTTIDRYGHPDREAHRNAAEAAAQWWRGGAQEAALGGLSVPPVVPQRVLDVRERPEAPVGTGPEAVVA